jgi:hypothetical protein
MGKRKGGTPTEEIEAWARRMIDRVEDFEYATTQSAWRQFIDEKVGDGLGLSQIPGERIKQLNAIEHGRMGVFELWDRLEIQVGTTKTGRTWYRDMSEEGGLVRRGQFISRAEISARIDYYRQEMAYEEWVNGGRL